MAGHLDGMRKQKVISTINGLVSRHTKGLFKDQHWAPVQAIRAELE